MAGEPTKPKSESEVPSRKPGSLPEERASSSEDIAAFVAQARAMSPLWMRRRISVDEHGGCSIDSERERNATG